jgi:hypothetical protein
MVERLYKLRLWIGLLAVVMTAVAIERTIQSGRLHGIGEAVIALVFWALLAWGLLGRGKETGAARNAHG